MFIEKKITFGGFPYLKAFSKLRKVAMVVLIAIFQAFFYSCEKLPRETIVKTLQADILTDRIILKGEFIDIEDNIDEFGFIIKMEGLVYDTIIFKSQPEVGVFESEYMLMARNFSYSTYFIPNDNKIRKGNVIDLYVNTPWIRKLDFPREIRWSAASFSIDDKGYVIGGGNGLNEVWEYNSTNNTWSRKSDFPGVGRIGATGFSLGGKGYITSGSTNYLTGHLNDLWEYIPVNDSWQRKADFPGEKRNYAVSFIVGNKGYVGTGFGRSENNYCFFNDFWEYSPTTDSWYRIADFEGNKRGSAVAFSLQEKGYVGLGGGNGSYYKDFWEYSSTSNSWKQIESFPGTSRIECLGFALLGAGYITTGHNENEDFSDFWQYCHEKNSWVKSNDFPGNKRYGAVVFVLNNKAYITAGASFYNDFNKNDLWEFDPEYN